MSKRGFSGEQVNKKRVFLIALSAIGILILVAILLAVIHNLVSKREEERNLGASSVISTPVPAEFRTWTPNTVGSDSVIESVVVLSGRGDSEISADLRRGSVGFYDWDGNSFSITLDEIEDNPDDMIRFRDGAGLQEMTMSEVAVYLSDLIGENPAFSDTAGLLDALRGEDEIIPYTTAGRIEEIEKSMGGALYYDPDLGYVADTEEGPIQIGGEERLSVIEGLLGGDLRIDSTGRILSREEAISDDLLMALGLSVVNGVSYDPNTGKWFLEDPISGERIEISKEDAKRILDNIDIVYDPDTGEYYAVDENGNRTLLSEESQRIIDELRQSNDIMVTPEGVVANPSATSSDSKPETLSPEEEQRAQWREETEDILGDEYGIGLTDFIHILGENGVSLNDYYDMLASGRNMADLIDLAMDTVPEADPNEDSPFTAMQSQSDAQEEAPNAGYADYLNAPWLNSTSAIEDSLNAMVSQLGSASGASTREEVNRTQEKQSWLDEQESLPVGWSQKLTKYDIAPGTVIPITMISGIDTDNPGSMVMGEVRGNVYDSLTHSRILIPKGSRVYANYNTGVAFGQTRLQIAWTMLIFPTGEVFNLPGFQGITGEGYAGIKDRHTDHIFQIIGASMLGTVIDFGSYLADSTLDYYFDSTDPLLAGLINALGHDAADNVSSLGQQYAEYWMNVNPTIRIRPGHQTLMYVNQIISFKK